MDFFFDVETILLTDSQLLPWIYQTYLITGAFIQEDGEGLTELFLVQAQLVVVAISFILKCIQ